MATVKINKRAFIDQELSIFGCRKTWASQVAATELIISAPYHHVWLDSDPAFPLCRAQRVAGVALSFLRRTFSCCNCFRIISTSDSRCWSDPEFSMTKSHRGAFS